MPEVFNKHVILLKGNGNAIWQIVIEFLCRKIKFDKAYNNFLISGKLNKNILQIN